MNTHPHLHVRTYTHTHIHTHTQTQIHSKHNIYMQDGRIIVTSQGKKRFEIKSVTKEKPVLLCTCLFFYSE
jgi:hypothetical protein